MSTRTPEEIAADIEVQRDQLAGTVDALAAKLDVKQQARARVEDAKATASARVGVLKERATSSGGRPRPELLALAGTVLLVTVAVVWWRHR